MMEIAEQHRLDVVVEVTERFHQVGRRRVARAVLVLRARHHRVRHHFRVAAQAPDEIAHRLRRRGETRLVDVADHQGAGIDERVARLAALELQLHQGVERLAGGLVAEALPDVLAGMLDRLDQAEHLGNALDGKRPQGVAGMEQLAVAAVHGDPQLVRLDAGERGNVVGDLAAPDQRADFIENLVQQLLHDDLRGDTGAPTRAHPGQRECAAS